LTFDVSSYKEFDTSESSTDYYSLIESLKWTTREWFKEKDVYFETHHVYPKSERVKGHEKEVVLIPIKFHFLAHVFRAKEHELMSDLQNAYRNWAAAALIMRNARVSRHYAEIKNNVLASMNDLSKLYDVAKKSREWFLSIKQDKRDWMKKVARLEDGKVYDSLRQAATENGLSMGNLCATLKGDRLKTGGYHWKYADAERSLEETIEKETKRRDSNRPNVWITKILQEETGKVYNGLKEVVAAIGDCNHVIECCRGLRKTALGYHWRFA
jgi:hypothetical protein